jgi:hypothetical protein
MESEEFVINPEEVVPQEEHEESSNISLAIFFLVVTLCLGGLTKEVVKRIPIPYPAAMFILGKNNYSLIIRADCWCLI